jgi:predicted nucleic acid-binding protein
MNDYQVVLDACVLVNAALRDTLLRIAEPPRLYLPRWSEEIMQETMRALETKLGVPAQKTAYLTSELRKHFADAWVEGYEPFIPAMTNDLKDRHVLAVAVRCGAQTIVTHNLKHFPDAALAPWNVEAQSPDEFLVHQYYLAPRVVAQKLREQAAQHGGIERLLNIHIKIAPEFVALISPELIRRTM